MRWFPGSIKDAVTAAKQRKATFVVFVEDENEDSVESARVINSEITSRLEHDDFVAVRVDARSESYEFFKQIYHFVPVPSLFFIGTNGEPIDSIVGRLNPSVLVTRIDCLLETLGIEASVSSSSFIQAEQNIASTTNVPKTSGSSTLEAQSPECSLEKTESSTDETKPSDITTEEKLEKARQLIEIQKRQKIEKEREDEKKREIERRQLGKDVQMAKQKQHEAEIKLALDERMREKAAEAEAKDKVLRQIAQDKLERKQRELALQQQVSQQQQENQQERPVEQPSVASTTDGTIARIQFRLPLGSPHMGKFEATSTLGSLRSYVASNIELPFQKFAMSTTFPRRDLTADNDGKTLEELELVPTAVILILPVKNSKVSPVVTSSDDIGFVSRFVWALFAPIVSIYNYVMGYFAGGPTSPPERRRSDGNVRAPGAAENSERFGRVLGQSSGLINRNLLGGPSTTIRSRGNIHRLHSDGDDNDENNTWNGNSTQQM